MPSRPDEDSRPTTEVDPAMMRELLAHAHEPVTVVEPLPAVTKPMQPRMRRYVIGAAIACLATLWVAATGWLLATW